MKKAFTLMEMIIVFLIMGIIVMLFTSLTGNQIQKLQQKTVKEQILSTYTSYYSKNLTSSIFGGTGYETMTIAFSSGTNTIDVNYHKGNTVLQTLSVAGDFLREKILAHPHSQEGERTVLSEITLTMTPYEIACTIGDNLDNIVLVAKIKEQDYACFEISSKTCRMRGLQCLNGVRIYDT